MALSVVSFTNVSTFLYHFKNFYARKTLVKKIFLILFLGIALPLSIRAENLSHISLLDPAYNQFFEYARSQVNDDLDECAKFVNRIFWARFDTLIWGDAWTIQLRDQNQPYLDLVWKLDEAEFSQKTYWVNTPEDRVRHFEDLYMAIEQEDNPTGVAGFLYRYSGSHQKLRELYGAGQKSGKDFLPQTHISFIAGRKLFSEKNTTNVTQSVKSLLEAKYGQIHDFEELFVNEKLSARKSLPHRFIDLESQIDPGQSFWYYDYFVQEQFLFSREDSLLGVFLRKHRNNKVTALLRPVSFSRVKADLFTRQ